MIKLDLLSIAFVCSLVFVAESIAVYIQYRVNSASKAVKWWFAGSVAMALGFSLLLTVSSQPLRVLAALGNPLIVLGSVFLYIGVARFYGLPRKPWQVRLLYLAFLGIYFLFIVTDNISGRTVVISAVLTLLSLMTAHALFFKKRQAIAVSSNFTAAVFFIYGGFHAARVLLTLVSPQIATLTELNRIAIQVVIFLVPILASILWTYGFVLMLNQRLNSDILNEKENLRTVFNANRDAQLIVRLSDGIVTDANEAFSRITGYTYEEIANKALDAVGLAEPSEKGLLEQLGWPREAEPHPRELVLRRKDSSVFWGLLFGKVIVMDDAQHMVLALSDITERKGAEAQINELIAQLEDEKKTAQTHAITDSLTGLLNRRCFEETLRHEFGHLRRSALPISLIMFDVDHFKLFNDTYGHLAGDECLRRIADAFRSVVSREQDVLVRYGGEEFIAILPDTGSDGALLLADQIRMAVVSLRIPHATSPTAGHVTVSVGAVTANPADISSPEKLVRLADEALYQAKDEGRNRTVIHPAEGV